MIHPWRILLLEAIPFLKDSFIYIRERDHASWGRNKGRRRETQADSQLSAEPYPELDPAIHEIMTWAEISSQILNQMGHPGAPGGHFKFRDNFDSIASDNSQGGVEKIKKRS